MSIVIIAFIILALAKTLPLFLIGAFVYGIGYGSSLPTLNAIMIKLCPPDRRGVGNATYFIATDLGSEIGAVLWGIRSQNYGFHWAYLICAASVVVSLTLYLNLVKKRV